MSAPEFVLSDVAHKQRFHHHPEDYHQGHLMKAPPFNPYQRLTKLASSQTTSVLKASCDAAIWHIYLENGELLYADCAAHTLGQLNYLLCCQGLERVIKVLTVDAPIEASSIIFRIQPDLISLDITMPKINGYRLCDLLRSSAMFDHTPIIMVTGNTGLIDKARAKLAGATDYFTKPFTQQSLTRPVEKYLTSMNLSPS